MVSGQQIVVGTDLVYVPRIAHNAMRLGASFLNRSFTEAELALCGSDAQRLAGRWAAKEATLKALGLGLAGAPMSSIEVLAEGSGAPVLTLSGAAESAATAQHWINWSVSISHDGDYASASVVALKRS